MTAWVTAGVSACRAMEELEAWAKQKLAKTGKKLATPVVPRAPPSTLPFSMICVEPWRIWAGWKLTILKNCWRSCVVLHISWSQFWDVWYLTCVILKLACNGWAKKLWGEGCSPIETGMDLDAGIKGEGGWGRKEGWGESQSISRGAAVQNATKHWCTTTNGMEEHQVM